jgi:epoxyqueuosine reductase
MADPVIVIDTAGQRLTPCSQEKAAAMLSAGKATLVSSSPLTIQVPLVAKLKLPKQDGQVRAGTTLLLHICCGPCSTASIEQLRQHGFDVTGFWYNPNVHPLSEHELRRQCVSDYAPVVNLPMIEWPGYDMPAYFRAVAGHEDSTERCAICYRLRLARAAQVAQERGFDAFTTTLLISPYQQQSLIRQIGEEQGQLHHMEFYFENLRRGWKDRGQLSRDHGLYQQKYCGCLYSEWEASQSRARHGAQASGD